MEQNFNVIVSYKHFFTHSHIPEAWLWSNYDIGSRTEVPKNAGWRHSSYSHNCAFRRVNTMEQSVPRPSYGHLRKSVTIFHWTQLHLPIQSRCRISNGEKNSVDGIQWRPWLLIMTNILWNMACYWASRVESQFQSWTKLIWYFFLYIQITWVVF